MRKKEQLMKIILFFVIVFMCICVDDMKRKNGKESIEKGKKN
jgi:hypothetical protein